MQLFAKKVCKKICRIKILLYLCIEKQTNNKMKATMRKIFHALIKEMGQEEGKSIFEWYCKTYGVTIEDDAPASVAREVLGI